MTSPWLLPTVVLALGLIAGVVVALRLRAGGAAAATADLDLRRRDLRRTYEQSLEALRAAPSGTDADRLELERRAARALRDLEALPRPEAPGSAPRPAASNAEAPRRGDWFQRHPLASGALLGGGLVGLVALLIVWAIRDATPDPAPAATAGAGAMAPTTAEERGEPPLPPVVAQQVQELRDRIASEPDDLGPRRELAQLLLVHSQYFDAFQEARSLLERDPDDPDGLYVSALVRYTMGQAEPAVELLERAVSVRPASPQAWLVLGLVRLQLGERQRAVETWEQGIAAAGADPRLDHVLRLAREGRSAEEIFATPPP